MTTDHLSSLVKLGRRSGNRLAATFLTKGMWARAEWMEALPNVSIAGVQPKVVARLRVAEGVITHIRGNRQEDPTSVVICLKTVDGSEVVVPLEHIVYAEI